MASSSGPPVTIVIPGQRASEGTATRGAASEAAADARIRGRIKHSVRVGAHRDAGQVRITATPGEDVVILQIAGGPALTLHPETARDLILAQRGGMAASRGDRAADAAFDGVIEVPAQLQWRGRDDGVAARGATRGFFGDVVLSAVDVVTDLITGGAAD